MKLLFITAQTPLGKGETFILEELLELKKQKINFIIIPRSPSKEFFHKKSEKLSENIFQVPLINTKIITIFFWLFLINPVLWKILLNFIKYSRSPFIFIKNLAIFPKSVFIVGIIRKKNINHIHAHWGSTTATMAYIISKMSGISWSFTLHRWDIKEDNMLREKVKSAQFVRCISNHGKKELFEIIGEEYKEKIKVIHIGVRIPGNISKSRKKDKSLMIAVPANLIKVKGHKYLIEAFSNLNRKGVNNFQCTFYGKGPLKKELENLIKEKKLTGYIKITDFIPHEELIKMYNNKEIDMVILPSITTKKDHEGIPVSLMEAMAFEIPVISTDTGGISELISNRTGVLVKEKDSKQLSEAILKIIKEKIFRKKISVNGRKKIEEDFNIENNVKILIKQIQVFNRIPY